MKRFLIPARYIPVICQYAQEKQNTYNVKTDLETTLLFIKRLTSTMAKMDFDNIPLASFAMRDLSEDAYVRTSACTKWIKFSCAYDNYNVNRPTLININARKSLC